MALLFAESDNLIFNTRTVPGSDTVNFSAVKRGAVQIFKNDLFRFLVRLGNVTGQYVFRLIFTVKRKWHNVFVAVLTFKIRKVNASAVDS